SLFSLLFLPSLSSLSSHPSCPSCSLAFPTPIPLSGLSLRRPRAREAASGRQRPAQGRSRLRQPAQGRSRRRLAWRRSRRRRDRRRGQGECGLGNSGPAWAARAGVVRRRRRRGPWRWRSRGSPAGLQARRAAWRIGSSARGASGAVACGRREEEHRIRRRRAPSPRAEAELHRAASSLIWRRHLLRCARRARGRRSCARRAALGRRREAGLLPPSSLRPFLPPPTTVTRRGRHRHLFRGPNRQWEWRIERRQRVFPSRVAAGVERSGATHLSESRSRRAPCVPASRACRTLTSGPVLAACAAALSRISDRAAALSRSAA
ncbi:unnamed protein product, partial [Urochloa humidicola]